MRFAEFWTAWPRHKRKKDREKCQRRWEVHGLDAEADTILASLGAWKSSEDWARESGRFVPAPLVWLNQRVWEAAPPEPVVAATANASGLLIDGPPRVPTPEEEAEIAAEISRMPDWAQKAGAR